MFIDFFNRHVRIQRGEFADKGVDEPRDTVRGAVGAERIADENFLDAV